MYEYVTSYDGSWRFHYLEILDISRYMFGSGMFRSCYHYLNYARSLWVAPLSQNPNTKICDDPSLKGAAPLGLVLGRLGYLKNGPPYAGIANKYKSHQATKEWTPKVLLSAVERAQKP